MRLKNIPGAKEEMLVNPFVIREPETKKGSWKKEVFGNDHPLFLEIGCGKGIFLTTLSERHPEINYLGIEKYSSVLLRAVQHREAVECDNLFYLRFDAEYVNNIFAPGEIDRLYLNFSDPWPKDRHWKRRLTSTVFLDRYEEILAPGALVEFKTDNEGLFDFSVESAKEKGWEILVNTRDLHRSEYAEGNVMTEYEDRFVTLGKPIFKMVIRKTKEERS